MYPVRWTAQSALHFIPWQTCSFRYQLDFSGKHSSHTAIMREDFIHISTTVYTQVHSFIQLSELGCRGENENMKGIKGDSNRALLIASPEFYRRATAVHIATRCRRNLHSPSHQTPPGDIISSGVVRDLRDFWFKFFQKHKIWLICPLWYTV